MLTPIHDEFSQEQSNQANSQASKEEEAKKKSMTETLNTSVTLSAHVDDNIPQTKSEQKVLNLVKKIQEMSHPEIKQKALEVF